MDSSKTRHKVAIHWFRRDLRLTDNLALSAAASRADTVIPVYVVSDWSRHHRWTGAARQEFLCGALGSLSKNLASIGSCLVVREGNAAEVIPKLVEEAGATAIFFNGDPDPFGRAKQEEVSTRCQALGAEVASFLDHVIHGHEDFRTGGGSPYRVFTPYSKRWFAAPKPSVGGKVSSLGKVPDLASAELPSLAHWGLSASGAQIIEPGERAARKRMEAALASGGVAGRYGRDRDTPAGQTTSRLGQDLRFGLISPRDLVARAFAAKSDIAAAGDRAGEDSVHTFIKELAWREFYMQLLRHFPDVLDWEFNAQWRGLPWKTDESSEQFRRWCEGETGFPIIDAGMRQLAGTGFMHNRVRMIVSMFLTKDLQIDWRLGEAFFMRSLVDGEIASNNGGWQWSAGTGADAAPYFRVQNPWTQTKRWDPNGSYIKEWVPELKNVDPKRFQVPAEPLDPLAPGYPAPMVDHSAERDRVLAMFSTHRERMGSDKG